MRGYFRLPMMNQVNSAIIFGDIEGDIDFIAGLTYDVKDERGYRFVA